MSEETGGAMAGPEAHGGGGRRRWLQAGKASLALALTAAAVGALSWSGGAGAGGAADAGATAVKVSVPAATEETAPVTTSIDAGAGVTLTCSGTIVYGLYPTRTSKCTGPVGLVYRIGTGPWRPITSSPLKIKGSGKISLAVFDSLYADNTGTYVVTISAGSETITGTVKETSCGASSCTQKGLAGVKVVAAGAGGGSAVTRGDGSYSIDVDEGSYTVTPSLGGRTFDPATERVAVRKGATATASFTTCAQDRQTQSALGAERSAASACALSVSVSVAKSVKSGKSFRGAKKAVPVSFVEPSSTGQYKWWCSTGCVNLRIKIRDPKTKEPPPSALVVVTAKVGGAPVTPGSRNGVFCRAVDAHLQKPCGVNSSTELTKDGDLDLYYWVPGVIEPTTATLVVTVRSPKYPRVLKEVQVKIQPNVAYSKSIELVRRTAEPLVWFASLTRGVAIGDFLSYCDKLVSAISDTSGAGLSSGEKAAALWAADFVKQFKGACGKIPSPSILGKLAPIGPWKLWTTFRPEFGFAPNGLLGTTRLSDRLFQVFFNYSGFFEAFTKGLTEFVYHDLDPANPDATTPSIGSRLQLKVWEVSHRLPSGKVKDALYLKLIGGRGAKAFPAADTLVEGGYWPGCWLNPALSSAEFSLVSNVCTNKYDDEYIR